MNSLSKFAIGAEVKPIPDAGNNLTGDVTTILSIIIGALGLVAVVVMIIGGYNYMTSTGDASKVEKAKKTILYGLIGLIVCALAFVIVNFVIGTILAQNNSGNDTSGGASQSRKVTPDQ